MHIYLNISHTILKFYSQANHNLFGAKIILAIMRRRNIDKKKMLVLFAGLLNDSESYFGLLIIVFSLYNLITFPLNKFNVINFTAKKILDLTASGTQISLKHFLQYSSILSEGKCLDSFIFIVNLIGAMHMKFSSFSLLLILLLIVLRSSVLF